MAKKRRKKQTQLASMTGRAIRSLERLEAREMLWSSGGNAAIAISSDTVPEGVPEMNLVAWTDFGPQGGEISYSEAGGSAQPGRDVPSVGGSVSVGSSGTMLLNIPTLPDDAEPSDFDESFSEAVHVYTPGYGQPGADGSDFITEGGPSTPVVPNNVCGCGNVEASVNPASGASIVSFGDGDPTEAMNCKALLTNLWVVLSSVAGRGCVFLRDSRAIECG